MDAGVVGHRAQRGAAGDELAQCNGPLAEKVVDRQPLVELLGGETGPGGHVDRVFAALRGRAVGGDTLELDLDLHPAALAAVEAAVGGLGAHDHLGPDPVFFDDVLPAQAVAVLLDDAADEVHRQIPVQAQFLQDAARGHHGGNPALLVRGPAAVDKPVADLPAEGVEAPVGRVAHLHGVDVAVERQDAFAVSDAADHVAEPVDFNLVEAGGLHLLDQFFAQPLSRPSSGT